MYIERGTKGQALCCLKLRQVMYALWQRTLKKLRTLKHFSKCVNLGPNQCTLKKKISKCV